MALRRVSIGGILLALFLLSAIGPTTALNKEGFTIRIQAPVTKKYDPLIGNYPFNDARNPDTCSQVAVTYCDVIPIKIEPPGRLGPQDDWLVRIQLSWDYTRVEGNSGNNLHLRLYTQVGTTVLYTSDCCEPEEILLLNPTATEYRIQVSNVSGANTGYTLYGDIRISSVDPIFELQEDTFSGGGSFEAGMPGDLSEVPGDTTALGVETASPIPLAFINPDGTFNNLTPRGDGLSDLLESPSSSLLLGEEAVPPPGPVSGVQVLMWGGFLPLALLAAGYLWMRTRGIGQMEFETA